MLIKETLKKIKHMNKIALYILTIGLFISSCSNKVGNKNHIVVSILPQKQIISQLVPDDFKVTTMVTQGNSPATYSPSPVQIKDINDSHLYIKIGNIGFEQAWIDRFCELNPQLKVEDSSKGIEFIRGEAEIHGDHVHEGGIEPHIWTSPKTMLQVVENTKDILVHNYPELTQTIESNYITLRDSLINIDSLYTQKLNNFKGKSFLIFHPAYTYLARDYGLKQISIEHNGKEPSVKWIQEIIDFAKSENIKAIFVQEEFDKRNAEIISKELGIEIIEVHPLKEDYETEMKNLLNKLETIL